MGYRIQEALLKAYACFTACVDAGRSGRAADRGPEGVDPNRGHRRVTDDHTPEKRGREK